MMAGLIVGSGYLQCLIAFLKRIACPNYLPVQCCIKCSFYTLYVGEDSFVFFYGIDDHAACNCCALLSSDKVAAIEQNERSRHDAHLADKLFSRDVFHGWADKC